MPIRAIIHEWGVAEQLSDLDISYRRYDELMEYIEEVLASHPEAFSVIAGTKISLCKTNEFVGNSFGDIPSLAIYFHYDESTVRIIFVETNDQDSYGDPRL